MERFKTFAIKGGKVSPANNLLRGVPVGKKHTIRLFSFAMIGDQNIRLEPLESTFLSSINKSKEAPSMFSTSLEISFPKDLMIHSVLSLNRREKSNCLV